MKKAIFPAIVTFYIIFQTAVSGYPLVNDDIRQVTRRQNQSRMNSKRVSRQVIPARYSRPRGMKEYIRRRLQPGIINQGGSYSPQNGAVMESAPVSPHIMPPSSYIYPDDVSYEPSSHPDFGWRCDPDVAGRNDDAARSQPQCQGSGV